MLAIWSLLVVFTQSLCALVQRQRRCWLVLCYVLIGAGGLLPNAAGATAVGERLRLPTLTVNTQDTSSGSDSDSEAYRPLTPLSPLAVNQLYPPFLTDLKKLVRHSFRYDRKEEFAKRLKEALSRIKENQSTPAWGEGGGSDDNWEAFDSSRIKTFWLEVLTCSIAPPAPGLAQVPDDSLSFFQFLRRHEQAADLSAKLKLLAYYGWFMAASLDELGVGLSCSSTNLDAAIQELRYSQSLSPGLTASLIDAVMGQTSGKGATPTAVHELWDEADRRDFKAALTLQLNDHHEAIFRALLGGDHFSAAIVWLRGLFISDVQLFVPGNEGARGLSASITSPLLELVLEKMLAARQITNDQVYNSVCGEWCDDATIDDVIKRFLPEHPFTSAAYTQLQALKKKRPKLLSPERWQAMATYLGHGMVKSAFAELTGEYVVTPLLRLSDDGEAVKELVHYINGKDDLFIEFRRYGGLEHLLLLERTDHTHVLRQAVLARNYMAIVYLYFLYPQHKLTPDATLCNEFHLVLAGRSDLPTDEAAIAFIIKFFLYAPRLESRHIVSALRQKNQNGETPLLMAAKLGLHKCFELMQAFLLAEGYYDQSEHSGEDSIGQYLYRGLWDRLEKIGLNRDEKWVQKLEILARSLRPIRRYQADDPAAAAKMQQLMTQLEPLINTPLTARIDPVKQIYRPAVATIFRHFRDAQAYPGFNAAPLSVRMSYYEEPFRRLITRMFTDFPADFLTNDVLFDYLCAESVGTMDRFEERAFRRFIRDEKLKLQAAAAPAVETTTLEAVFANSALGDVVFSEAVATEAVVTEPVGAATPAPPEAGAPPR